MTEPEMPLELVGQPQVPPAASGSYPVRTGNIVRPLVDGIPAFRRIGEAIDGARHSVWLTVTFFAPDFRFPDGDGSLFDVLDHAVALGLDVRVIFWRPNPESSGYGRTFPGSQAERDLLQARGSRFRIRWDRAHAAYCQPQKSWVIDAGQPTETAFVGGTNLTSKAMGLPGHFGGGERHDLDVEVTGPSATDVHHNFIQRWNEASEREADDGVWADNPQRPCPFPHACPTRKELVSCKSSVWCIRATTRTATPRLEDCHTTLRPGNARYWSNTSWRSTPREAQFTSKTKPSRCLQSLQG